MPTYERPTTKNDLKAVRQYKGEMLCQYIQRFSHMKNKIPQISNEEVISAFSTGVADIKMKEKLFVNDEPTSVVRLFEIADRCAKAEEGKLFMHNLPEELPPKSKSKDPKHKEAAALTEEPNNKQHRGDHSERDKGGRRRYCIFHNKDTHNTDNCWVVHKFHEENGVTKRRGSSRSYTARVDHGVTAVTMTGTKVAAAMVHHVQIPSRYRCLHRQAITEKRTKGAIKSREASPPASWVEPKLLYLIVTSSSCRERLRWHNQAYAALG
jgi:hypothetical protein